MPNTELLLRVNGIQAAFGFELGSESPRVEEGRGGEPYRQANVSYSLVQRSGGEVRRHTLIDVGMGVMPSLVEFERSHGVHVVHEVLITHPHFDHFAQLDWLSMALLRNGRSDQPRPLPAYASQACWDAGPNRVFPYLAERSEFHCLQPGNAVALGDATITPFAVDHGPKALGALGFVVQHGGRKIVITGDCLRVCNEDDPLLFGADVCFMDANTWHPADHTSHQSILADLRLAEKWRSKRTYLLHYSGHEDRNYPHDPIHEPISLARLEEEVRRASGSRDVRVARHGMILGDDVAWPGG